MFAFVQQALNSCPKNVSITFHGHIKNFIKTTPSFLSPSRRKKQMKTYIYELFIPLVTLIQNPLLNSLHNTLHECWLQLKLFSVLLMAQQDAIDWKVEVCVSKAISLVVRKRKQIKEQHC